MNKIKLCTHRGGTSDPRVLYGITGNLHIYAENENKNIWLYFAEYLVYIKKTIQHLKRILHYASLHDRIDYSCKL